MTALPGPPLPEEWNPIPDWPAYDVSTYGRVRRGVSILTPFPAGQGYLMVTLSDGGQSSNRYVHRLVLEVFRGLAPAGMEGAFLDGNRTNLVLSNLVWAPPGAYGGTKPKLPLSVRRAIAEARAQGRSVARVAVDLNVSASSVRRWGGPTKGPARKVAPSFVGDIKSAIKAGISLREIGRRYGVSATTIARIRDTPS